MYAMPDDVRKVLSPNGEPDDLQTAAGYSDAILSDMIKRAEAKVHTYLAKRYTIPVDAVTFDQDGILCDWTAVIAAYFATLAFSQGQDVGQDDPVRLRYNDTMKTLDRIQSGNLSPAWPIESTNTTNDLTVVNRYNGEMFTPDDFDLGDSRRPYGWGVLPGWGDRW